MKKSILLVLLLSISWGLVAAPVNLSPPALPAASMCTGSGATWSYSSGTKTYTCNGRIVFPSNSSYTAKSTVTFYGLNGVSVNNTTVGTAKARINLRSDYGSIDITGTAQRLFYGDVTSASGNLNLNQMSLNGLIQTNAVLTISNSTVSGTVVASNGVNATATVFGGTVTANSGSIQLSGGQVAGLVRTACCNLTTNGTSLFGGATVHSGISLTGGTVQGGFTMTALNAVVMNNVTMTAGSVTGASTITLNNTTAGSTAVTVNMTSNTGVITLNNSTVYGYLTAPAYSSVVVQNSSSVYGGCTPTNTACGSVVVTPSDNCPAPNSNPSTGTAGKVIVNEMSFHGSNSNNDWFELYVNEGVHNLSGWTVTLKGRGGINEIIPLPAITFPWSNTTSGRFIILAASTADSAISNALSSGSLVLNTNLFVNSNIALHNTLQELLVQDANGNLVYYMGYANANNTDQFVYDCAESFPDFADTIEVSGQENSACTIIDGDSTVTENSDWNTSCSGTPTVGTSNDPESLLTRFLIEHVPTAAVGEETLVTVKACANTDCTAFVDEDISVNLTLVAGAGNFGLIGGTPSSTSITLNFAATGQDQVVLNLSSSAIAQLALTPVAPATALPGGKPFSCLASNGATNCLISSTASLHHYELSYNPDALTCQAQTVTIKACADAACNSLFTNSISLTMVATDTSNTATWVGGSAVTFSGGSTTKILRQTGTGSSVLGISAPSAVASEPALVCSSSGCVVNFVDAAFVFYDSGSSAGIQNQVAGLDGSARLRAVKRNTTTGACEARLTGIKTVNFGFACVNPGSCQAGTSLKVNGSSINGVPYTSPINLSATASLTFDNNGYAPFSLNYSDVGEVQLAARLNLAASGNDPATAIEGYSANFVVKPHHVAVINAKRLDNFVNQGTLGTGAGFAAAGEEFAVSIEVQNAQNQRTPNFGLESVAETVKLAPHSLIYPSGVGASTGVIETTTGFSLAGSAGGLFDNQTVYFSEVGSIAVTGQLADNNYLGAGDAYTNATPLTIGRFYPDYFAVKINSAVTDANTPGNFSYMGQTGISAMIEVEARNRQGNVTVNYDKVDLNYPVSSLYPVLENNNAGNDLAGRLNLSLSDAWNNGLWTLNRSDIRFDRLTETTAAQPDGPYPLAQFGLRASDTLDSRTFQGMTMNATTSSDCIASANCNAVAVGNSLNLLYGRLELQNISGPEDTALPLILQAKYWNGQTFLTNTADQTTLADRANLVIDLTTPEMTINTGGTAAALLNGNSRSSAMQFLAPNQIVSIPFRYTTPAYLQYHWNGTVLSDPTAEALFGRYRGNKRQIFWQERLN